MRYVALLGTIAIFALAGSGCGSKSPKYPACGKDKDCRDGEHCVNKQCLQCAVDSHCDDGEKCVKGGCVAPKGDNDIAETSEDDALTPCTTNSECEDDEDCVDKRCRRPWASKSPEGIECKLETVYFGYNRDLISGDARNSLASAADCIKKAPEGQGVYLVGHTDPRGTEEYNIALSERRARAVADYLANLGIDPARFRVVPKGETSSAGFDQSSWERDRRVEFEWQ